MHYFNKGNDLYNLKNYKEAILLYKKSIELNQYDASSYYNSAVCFIKLKEYSNAIPHLEQALKIKNDSKYFFNLAYCYAMLKNYKKALLYFNTSWAKNPTDSDCEKAIRLILSRYKI